MISEEQDLKKRLLISIEACRKEVTSLCSELQVKEYQVSPSDTRFLDNSIITTCALLLLDVFLCVWQEDDSLTMLQLEKDLRTQVKTMLKEKSARESELKSLIQQDQDLCDILCDDLFPIHPERVPSQQQLQSYRQHISACNQERVKHT